MVMVGVRGLGVIVRRGGHVTGVDVACELLCGWGCCVV